MEDDEVEIIKKCFKKRKKVFPKVCRLGEHSIIKCWENFIYSYYIKKEGEKVFSSGNVVVDKLREINFDGNVIHTHGTIN